MQNNNNALIAIAAAATALAAAATALVSGNTGEQAEPLKEDSTEVIPPTTTRKRGRPAASTEPTAGDAAAPEPAPEPEKKETGKTLEQLRALIEPLVKGGQGDDVKKVIAKYAPKLSEIASKDHDAFTKDIEALSL